MSVRNVFEAIDDLTGDGLVIELESPNRLIARAIHPAGERVVIVTEVGAAERLGRALLAAIDETAPARAPRKEPTP